MTNGEADACVGDFSTARTLYTEALRQLNALIPVNNLMAEDIQQALATLPAPTQGIRRPPETSLRSSCMG